jgi:hypothetical protein
MVKGSLKMRLLPVVAWQIASKAGTSEFLTSKIRSPSGSSGKQVAWYSTMVSEGLIKRQVGEPDICCALKIYSGFFFYYNISFTNFNV